MKPVISATTANEMNSAYEAFLNRPTSHGRGSREDPGGVGAGGDGDAASSVGQASDSGAPFEPSGVRPRKPCNCTKSQCLKLYCDCFANGEFCFNCNCNNCFNNLQHEEERQKQIKQCLDRNPNAFKPKVQLFSLSTNRRRANTILTLNLAAVCHGLLLSHTCETEAAKLIDKMGSFRPQGFIKAHQVILD